MPFDDGSSHADRGWRLACGSSIPTSRWTARSNASSTSLRSSASCFGSSTRSGCSVSLATFGWEEVESVLIRSWSVAVLMVLAVGARADPAPVGDPPRPEPTPASQDSGAMRASTAWRRLRGCHGIHSRHVAAARLGAGGAPPGPRRLAAVHGSGCRHASLVALSRESRTSPHRATAPAHEGPADGRFPDAGTRRSDRPGRRGSTPLAAIDGHHAHAGVLGMRRPPTCTTVPN